MRRHFTPPTALGVWPSKPEWRVRFAPGVPVSGQYAPINSAPKFCRRSILLRDRFRCQICGEKFDAADLIFDHVIPRSAEGKT